MGVHNVLKKLGKGQEVALLLAGPRVRGLAEGKSQGAVIGVQCTALALNHQPEMLRSMVSSKQFPVKSNVPPLRCAQGPASEGEWKPPSGDQLLQ